MRKRSGAAARLQRALSTKSLRSESPPSQKTPISSLEQRTFLMEAPVQFSTVSIRSLGSFFFTSLTTKKKKKVRQFIIFFPFFFAGCSKPRSSSFSFQRFASNSESPIGRQFQTERKGANIGNLADEILSRRRQRIEQIGGYVFRYGMAYNERRCYLQVFMLLFFSRVRPTLNVSRIGYSRMSSVSEGISFLAQPECFACEHNFRLRAFRADLFLRNRCINCTSFFKVP